MKENARIAIAVVGLGAILPDAPNVQRFWENVKTGRYSISEVDPRRWDPAIYYDPDPRAPDKTYSKIGGWVREWEWDPMAWKLPVPPRVADSIDEIQKWGLSCARAALVDYGWPERALDPERTGVILGVASGGERQFVTALRLSFPEFARELERAPSFAALPAGARDTMLREAQAAVGQDLPVITEDTMPGELANIVAGRTANLLNLNGPNYICDAACASALAATSAAVSELLQGHCDAVITGGIDHSMNASAYIKFCKVGALSATGTRPFADGADGFVMGEGAAFFVLKRLEDAERDADRVYAVIRGLGGSSDGRGKGITAPNPVGQRLAVERAWKTAGLSPASASLIEGHGTSTQVGDRAEVEAMSDVLRAAGAQVGSIALGSVKSNIGHLKAGAGAAGLLKTFLALDEKVLPPSINFDRPNPGIDFARSPLRVNVELREWEQPAAGVRRAGVSAFGFGGTNFHAVVEEYVPGRLDVGGRATFAIGETPSGSPAAPSPSASAPRPAKPPLRGAAVIGAASSQALAERLRRLGEDAAAGRTPGLKAPAEADLRAAERVAIDFGDAADLAAKAALALRALETEGGPAAAGMWKALRARGMFRGHGPAPKAAFLYTGQGSQYAGMLAGLRTSEPIVRATFEEADRIMVPLLGRPLSEIIFVDPSDEKLVAQAEAALRETEITQPAVMAVDLALTRLLEAYGVRPDMVMGHSLGEYGALMAAGCLTFEHTLEAVSARGREMSHLSVDDRGVMAAVMAPLTEIQRVVAEVGPGVIVANVNSHSQAAIGGATVPVTRAMEMLAALGHQVVRLPVSHAFHTSIVAPASDPLRRALVRLELRTPRLPIVSNVTGDFYPRGDQVLPEMLDLLSRQVAEPVQFVKGLETLYSAGARVFIEVGPKKALHGFAEDVLGTREGATVLFTNHPKTGELESFNQALCGLYASGLGAGRAAESAAPVSPPGAAAAPAPRPEQAGQPAASSAGVPADDRYRELGRLLGEFLERNAPELTAGGAGPRPEPVVLTGAALGLPGVEHVFDDANVGRVLNGRQLIDVVPQRFRQAMLDKHITRLVKSEGKDPVFEEIDDLDGVIRLAARGGAVDLVSEFGLSADRVAAFDRTTELAIGAGIDALRDAGIPLVLRYHTTTVGTRLPDRWVLPEEMRDDTGIIFASAFPGFESMAAEVTEYERDRARRERLQRLEHLRARIGEVAELDREIHELRAEIERQPYHFDRRFLFKALPMGHAQFAEFLGARGPNTQINSACASTTQAIALAEDWIRAERCRRVVIVAADDGTSDTLLEWVGAGFLATGAAATDDVVEKAALPFDRRRHGMILGMGAAGIVVESAEAARERGIQPICEVVSSVTANSAYHGSRLDVRHIAQVMESLMSQAERRGGLTRSGIAGETLFVSHETYTPARGGSASAEVEALRAVFGADADRMVVTNTKGFTGHPLGVGIEDVVGVKALETGLVPPVPNFEEPDPELGVLNLSLGGAYPVRYALHLAAGFGSQISMVLLRWTPVPDGLRRAPDQLGYGYRIVDRLAWQGWLARAAQQPDPELEVVRRTLRIRDGGRHVAPAVPAAPEAKPAAPAPPAREPAAPAAAPAPPAAAPAPPAATPAPPAATPAPPAATPAAVSATPPAAAPPAPAVEPAAQAAGAAEAAAAPPAAPDGSDAVAEAVLALVAEKTGYPPEMLDLDLDLEADLGVDTVKQAELFVSVRESYGIPRDESVKLRDFPTLRHVIGFVRQRAQGATADGEAPGATPPDEPAPVPEEAPRTADPAPADRPARRARRTGSAASLRHRRPGGGQPG